MKLEHEQHGWTIRLSPNGVKWLVVHYLNGQETELLRAGRYATLFKTSKTAQQRADVLNARDYPLEAFKGEFRKVALWLQPEGESGGQLLFESMPQFKAWLRHECEHWDDHVLPEVLYKLSRSVIKTQNTDKVCAETIGTVNYSFTIVRERGR